MSSGANPDKIRRALDIAGSVATIVTCVVLVIAMAMRYFGPATRPQARPGPKLPKAPISLDGARTRGNPSAKVVLLEYTDFQCPYCARFARETLPTLIDRYVESGKVLLAYRSFPLPIHHFAKDAAMAAFCAGQQGKFWEAHEAFFADQANIKDMVDSLSTRLVLAKPTFSACQANEASKQVDADVAGAQALQLTSTPTLFIGTLDSTNMLAAKQVLIGARPVGEFERAIDTALQQSMSLRH